MTGSCSGCGPPGAGGCRFTLSRVEAPPVTEELSEILDEYVHVPGPLLLVLHAVQRRLGFIPQDAVPYIAERLNLSRAEVHGVLSFYHHFRRAAPGRHVIQICGAESCQAMGSDQLAHHARQRLGIEFHETTPDGACSLEP